MGNLYAYKLNEVLPYVIDTGFGVYATLVTVMNLDTWRGLPGKIREEMTEVSSKAADKYAEIIMGLERRSLDHIKTSKGQVIRLAPDEKARWETVSKKIMWEGWAKDSKALGVPGEEWLTRFHKLCKEYEKGSKYTSVWDVWDKEYLKK
jgi:TRAP-type C4-dicarboxylate transport system substrate-binding protein